MKDHHVNSTGIMFLRHQFIKESRRLKLYGRLNHNLFTTKQLLLPGITVDIGLKTKQAEFCLIRAPGVDEEYKIVINECKLWVRRVLFRETALRRVDNMLARGYIAKYPYTETRTHNFTIHRGSHSWTSQVPVSLGPKQPQRLFFVITDAESIDGAWENNPMVFPAAKYKLSQLEFKDLDSPLMYKPYKLDFDNEDCNRAYTDFVRIATDGIKTGRLPGITDMDFKGQYGIFALDNIPPNANIIISAKFKEEVPKNLCGIVFVQYDTYFTYNKYAEVQPAGYRPHRLQ